MKELEEEVNAKKSDLNTSHQRLLDIIASKTLATLTIRPTVITITTTYYYQ